MLICIKIIAHIRDGVGSILLGKSALLEPMMPMSKSHTVGSIGSEGNEVPFPSSIITV
jgi:hypothetical protein